MPILFGTPVAGRVDRYPSGARGCRCPVAGRSRQASCLTLSACPLRFAILAALAPIARLPGHRQPLAEFVLEEAAIA
jgi:hypothetical protein